MTVEVDVEPHLLSALFGRVGSAWRQLGQSEPYWSVLAAPKFRQERIAASRPEFYESGVGDRDLFVAAASRCGLALPAQGTCFELGCGLGRITLWLAQSFRHVVAADISAPHLALARDALFERRVTNVELCRLEGPHDLTTLPRFEAFFSYIVLQHNPPPVMRWLLQVSLEKLQPGGLGFFQLPTAGAGYTFLTHEYLKTPNQALVEMHILPEGDVLDVLDQTGCALLEAREHDCIGHPGWISKTFLIRKGTPP